MGKKSTELADFHQWEKKVTLQALETILFHQKVLLLRIGGTDQEDLEMMFQNIDATIKALKVCQEVYD